MITSCPTSIVQRFAPVLLLLLLSGCAEVRHDGTTDRYTLGKDSGATVYTNANEVKAYTVGAKENLTADYTVGQNDGARSYINRENGKRYSVGSDDRVTAHYILVEGPPSGQPQAPPRQVARSTAAPAPSAVQEIEGPIVIEASDVLFEFDKSVIRPRYYPILDEWVAFFLDNMQVSAEIHGHTDSTGPAAYNQKLSERRAQAVMRYLTDQGVEPDRLTSRGFGESRPIAPNTTPEGRQQNRRVELQF